MDRGLTTRGESKPPFPDAMPSPWTEGAWIGLAGDVPEGWQTRVGLGAVWIVAGWHETAIVEARPIPERTVAVTLTEADAAAVARVLVECGWADDQAPVAAFRAALGGDQ